MSVPQRPSVPNRVQKETPIGTLKAQNGTLRDARGTLKGTLIRIRGTLGTLKSRPLSLLPMGTATARDGKELYVSTGRGNSVVVIDTAKNAVETTIAVGNRAWGIALDPSGSKLYTANGTSNDVSVVDLNSRKELRRIKAGDGPWGITIVPKK